MNSTRTVQVTPELIKEALECYWRSIAMIKPNEEVTIGLGLEEAITVELVTAKDEVKAFRYDG